MFRPITFIFISPSSIGLALSVVKMKHDKRLNNSVRFLSCWLYSNLSICALKITAYAEMRKVVSYNAKCILKPFEMARFESEYTGTKMSPSPHYHYWPSWVYNHSNNNSQDTCHCLCMSFVVSFTLQIYVLDWVVRITVRRTLPANL